MVKKVIINLDLSETSGPDCISVVVLKNCRPELSYILAEIFNKCLKKNIWGLHSNFVNCKSFLESSSPDILALCETNLDGSIDSGNFSVRGYLPLIWKDSSTHMHGLAVYVKEGLPFARDLSLENSADSYLCFWLALLHSVSSFFYLCRLWHHALVIACTHAVTHENQEKGGLGGWWKARPKVNLHGLISLMPNAK